MLPVVTAATDLKRGQVLDAAMLQLASYRKQDVPSGALATIEEAVGRTVIIPLAAREPIEALKLANKGAGRGLAALIPNGMRAFTIQTPHVAADVGGLILPGNHVDVLLTAQSGNDDTTGGGMTTTLLQNVQILAVSKLLEAPEDSKPVLNDLKSVTLLVTPDQAARLDLGMNKGLLHLTLRNALDDRDADTRPATMNDLRLHQDKPLNVAVAKPSEAAKSPVEPTHVMIRTLRGLDAGQVLISLTVRPDCPTSGITAGPADKAAEDQPPLAEDDKGRIAVSKSEVP